MHVTRSHAQAPKRGRPQLICGVLRGILYDAITGSHIMQQEVAERMNDFIPQRVGHHEGPTIYNRPRRSGRDAFHMARITADPLEDIAVPGAGYTFGQLQMALALGDFQSLVSHHRPTMRLHLACGAKEGMLQFDSVLTSALANIRAKTN